MWFKKDVSKMVSASGMTTLIAEGTEVHGDIRFRGNLEVEGVVHGNIITEPGEEAAVRIMESGRVNGDVKVPHVVVNGSVIGEVQSSKYIELAANATVEGDVHYNIIEMVRGAQVNGSLIYSASANDAVVPTSQVAEEGAEAVAFQDGEALAK